MRRAGCIAGPIPVLSGLLLAATAAAAPAGRLVVESRLAREIGITAGDTVRVAPAGGAGVPGAFVVVGTHAPPPDPAGISRASRQAWMPITDLEALTGRVDRVSRFVLKARPGADVDSLVAALNTAQLGYRAHRADDVARESSQTFVVISNFHRAISLLAILAGTAFLAAIVLLQVQELRKSLGVLRVIGISRRRIYTIVVGETVLLANLGAAAGIGVAFVVSRGVNAYYQRFFDTDLVFSAIAGWHVALAFGLASAVGWLVGSLAGAYLFKLEVNEVLGR
jgi:putative ABC transport system permease protein